jgi:HlyD family secretion protein
MSRTRKIGILVALAVVAVIAWYAWPHLHTGGDSIRVSGNIEAVEVGVSFQIAGHVKTREVDEGDVVRAGQVVARLDPEDIRVLQAEADARSGELRTAEAALAALKNGSRPEEIKASLATLQKVEARVAELRAGARPQERQTAQAQRAAAHAEAERTKKDFERIEQLHARAVVPTEQYDQARAAYEVAAERLRQAQQQLDLVLEGPRREEIEQAEKAMANARSQYELVKEGPRIEDIHQAEGRVAQAEAALRAAKIRLSYATITAPMDGVVLSKHVEPGEYVAPGTPVVTMANLDRVWLRAYVDERDMGFDRHAPVEVTADADAKTVYKGRIGFISSEPEFTPKSVQTEKERAKLVYRIKIDIDNPQHTLKPGMPADATMPRGKNEGG